MAKQTKLKKAKKVLNNIWKYGTIITIIMVVLTGLVLGITTAYNNKQELVLNALNKYNYQKLGYEKPKETSSRQRAFEKSVKLSIKSNLTMLNEISSDAYNVEFLEYFNNALAKIENYSGDINELSSKLSSAEIDAWIITDLTGNYYYGSLTDGTKIYTDMNIYISQATTVDDLMAEFKGLLKQQQSVVLTSDLYGTFFITGKIGEVYTSVENDLTDVDKLLVIIRIMKCGYPTNMLDDIMGYFDTIKNS